MVERCNCDASCGENRYHDAGDPGCRFANEDEYHAHWDAVRANWNRSKKEIKMANNTKVSAKLAKVNESFTVNMYDNGYMVEISGKDKKDDWKTSKIMVSTIDDLVAIVKEISEMERDS